ncbi:MAG TPA: YceI family protein [Bacteroidia bacterium]|nr:YceI family protein [Bacteroidia bacterium]
MKTKTAAKLVSAALAIGVTALVFVTSCKKENTYEQVAASSAPNSTDVIDASIGGFPPTSYTTAGAWKVDKTHSNVMWETQYYGSGAALTGRFNNFNLIVKFDAGNPSNTTLKGWVQLSTYNTGESGRDAYGKCGPGYMGVKWDTVAKTSPTAYTLAPQAATDTAWFKSTSCVKYGSGYMVKGNFTFRGKTISIDMPMSYTGKSTTTNTTTQKKTDRAGLFGEFWIKANSVFGVNSTSINDDVLIRVDCNMVTNAY